MNRLNIVLLGFIFLLISCDSATSDEDPIEYEATLDDSLGTYSSGNHLPIRSVVTVLDVNKGTEFTVSDIPWQIQSSSYTKDGNSILMTSKGNVYKLLLYSDGVEEEQLDFEGKVITNYAISKNGMYLAYNLEKTVDETHQMFYRNLTTKQDISVSSKSRSWVQDWSPDNTNLLYVSRRNIGFDLFLYDVKSKKENRLTSDRGVDDGGSFSPDGSKIYFCSDRSGSMQIWKMDKDGSNQVQVTKDEFTNWYPHVSPDGLKVAYMSYEGNINGHPTNALVSLKVLNLKDNSTKTLTTFRGGYGSLTANPWSPDGKNIVYIKYEPLSKSL